MLASREEGVNYRGVSVDLQKGGKGKGRTGPVGTETCQWILEFTVKISFYLESAEESLKDWGLRMRISGISKEKLWRPNS